MGRPMRVVSVICLVSVLAACAPVAVGPELPRPAQPVATVVTTSTTIPTTTTTLSEAEILATECPAVFCLVYHIDEEAVWSDGEPVSPTDFARTVELLGNPQAGDPLPGYDLVTAVETVDDKTARLLFSEPFGPWQQMFTRLIPAQASGLQVPNVPTNGPFQFAEWVPGDRIVITRDPDWWSETDPLSGDPIGSVARVEFVFIPDPNEMVDALEAGEVDVISARADADLLEDLDGIEEARYVLAPGPFWEHIDFHHEDEMFSQAWVRQVFDMAIDRQKILDRTIRLLDPSADGLDNTVWMAETVNYEGHYSDRYDPAAAEQILVANGCVRDGSFYECGERVMRFVWASTNDDPLRAEIFDSVEEDLAAVGIDIVADLRSPSSFVTRDFLFGGPDVWQLINFSWRSLADPAGSNPTYYCDETDLNVNRYCSPEVAELVRSTETIVDPAARTAAYNEADRLYLEDLAVIPLYQKPNVMAWSSELTGPAPNYTLSTDMWNLATWAGKREIVVALPSEPTSLGALPTGDESANAVLSALMYGAFGMDPAHNHVPALVDSVDFVEG